MTDEQIRELARSQNFHHRRTANRALFGETPQIRRENRKRCEEIIEMLKEKR